MHYVALKILCALLFSMDPRFRGDDGVGNKILKTIKARSFQPFQQHYQDKFRDAGLLAVFLPHLADPNYQ